MTQAAHTPHSIREKVFSLLSSIDSGDRNDRGESLLFSEGCYAGHRFRIGNLQAVWMLNEDRIIVHNSKGRPIREFTMSELFETTAPREERKAG